MGSDLLKLCRSASMLAIEGHLNDPSDDDILIYAAERIESKVDYDEIPEYAKRAIIEAYNDGTMRSVVREGKKNVTLPDIDLPTEDDIVTSFFVSYNGEPAFVVIIENTSPTSEISKENMVAKAKIAAMPIMGGQGQEADIILFEQGEGA